jgi:catechol 2,3-dioxygenase-like lactoylglutathione lyase family enzyme
MFWRRLLVVSLAVVLAASNAEAQSPQVVVKSVGMTVGDMDRAVEFYSALTFQKVSDLEVFGDEFEHLEGVFGARMRMVRMQLGNEYLDLTQYLAPPGRPIPVDSRSNDLWFQHVAIVVHDMDQAFEKLRALKVQFVSTSPQTLPPSIKAAAGSRRSIFAIRMGIIWRSFIFHRAKAIHAGRRKPTNFFSASITPRLGSPAQRRV